MRRDGVRAELLELHRWLVLSATLRSRPLGVAAQVRCQTWPLARSVGTHRWLRRFNNWRWCA